MGENISFVNEYVNQVSNKFGTEYAQEHAYRIPLEKLLKSLVQDIKVINDPKQVAKSIRPDFIIFTGKNHDVLGGYIEAKDLDKNLDEIEKTDQLAKKYLPALSDLVLTNYLEFRRYVNGEKVETIEIGRLDKKSKKIEFFEDRFSALTNLLIDFINQPADKVVESADMLSSRLASKCLLLKEQIVIAKNHEREVFENENPNINSMKTAAKVGPLFDFYKSYRKMLSGDIKDEEYGDNLAQTFIYSLFSARLLVPDSELSDFSFKTALEYLPTTVPFLHSLYAKMQEFRRMGNIENIEWVLSDLTSILRQADMESVLSDFGRLNKNEDPIVHFYEGFLKAYDEGLRKDRGVWYTPKPVVKYIVDSIDDILKTRFGKKMGFADKDVIILDPACGTGTFLSQVVEKCKEKIDEGVWYKFVNENLVERLFGFEIMVAPYAISHLKLALSLSHYNEGAYQLDTLKKYLPKERINIVLTNTLEEPSHKLDLTTDNPLEKEALLADSVKRDKKVMVILGNPPYSVSTQNKNEWIDNVLMEEYKKEVKSERNIQPLSDDYIKFIRFAHWRIENTGHGVVGMITNNSYLSGLIHRGMRKSLLKDYDQIHILDLHGNSLLKETTPEGNPDQNVFDIRQGVSISICERFKNHDDNIEAGVYHGDLWGKRKEKYEYLRTMNLKKSTEKGEFERLPLSSANKFFVKKDFSKLEEYERYVSIRDIVPESAAGIATHRDNLLVSFERDELSKRINEIRRNDDIRYLKSKFKIKETKYWNLTDAQKAMRETEPDVLITGVAYRPFDKRCVYYENRVVERARFSLMKHLFIPNISLNTVRQLSTYTFAHSVVSDIITERCYVSLASREVGISFPLYLYLDKHSNSSWEKTELEVEVSYGLPKPKKQTVYRVPNLNPEIVERFEGALGLEFVSDGKGNLKKTFGPEDLYAYIYAVLHSPTYRTRYEEFLKIDFPKIPLLDNVDAFSELVKTGEELIELHLMKADLPLETQRNVTFKGQVEEKEKDCLVEKISFEKNRVCINKVQYFEPVSEPTWSFMIGGYQVLHKWLKDRKGRKHDDGRDWPLSFEEINHYKYIIYALEQTQFLMSMIDGLISKHKVFK